MPTYRTNLPQLSDKICITDAGLETDLCFNHGIDLPEFASYDLLRTQQGYDILYKYFQEYAELAQRFGVGLIMEAPTWRANADWGLKIGDSPDALHQLNLKAIELLEHIKSDYDTESTPIIASACIGPRGDGYRPGELMTAKEAKHYHSTQMATFAQSGADIVSALTLNYIEEAIGITLAAQQHDIPVCISFTVETDGLLPTGDSLAEAIAQVDQATDNGPAYYMINCAHPTHFMHILQDEQCVKRLKGIRANASSCSHAELDEAEVLDDGNPNELGKQFSEIRENSPHINVIGGCCGTDFRHLEQIAMCCIQ